MIWPPRSISSSPNLTLPVMRPVARTTREALNKTGVVSWYETTGEL